MLPEQRTYQERPPDIAPRLDKKIENHASPTTDLHSDGTVGTDIVTC
jgi:hypothetical protein